jgi:tRNA threonylcarbamoyladenosine biosynthesis protein TsaE
VTVIFSETISNLNSLDKISKKISAVLKPKTLLLIDGDLGSGKTTLVTQVMRDFGYTQASSPTYALRHTYEGVKVSGQMINIEHVDLYRLKDEEDVDSIGLWDVFLCENIVIVEWANRVPDDQWPLSWEIYSLQIQKKSDEQREYLLTKKP